MRHGYALTLNEDDPDQAKAVTFLETVSPCFRACELRAALLDHAEAWEKEQRRLPNLSGVGDERSTSSVYGRLSRSSGSFQQLTGLTEDEFAHLYRRLVPIYVRREYERLTGRPRQRAIGGGARYALSLQDRLLMTLMRLHLRLSVRALASLFGIDKSTVSRNTRRILTCLRELGEVPVRLRPPRRGRSLEEALMECPRLQGWLSAEEWP